ncbi:MAG: ferritin family protein [Planctomycetes bacterium]|nr:ferritin family protein [Planctomycetota bacterium]
MSVTFNADEVFEMAEQIERNGAKFYRLAAQNPNNSTLKSFLEELADMEAEHVKTFATMRTELAGGDHLDMYDPDNDAAKYLQAVVQGRIFDVCSKPSEKLSACETPRDVLSVAIELEKDSIVYYLAMKSRVLSETGREKIDAIIIQEMGHVLVLKDKLDNID